MEPFELNVIAQKKLITISGFMSQSQKFYINFLKPYERPRQSQMQCLKEFLKYEGNELITNIICFLLLIIAESIILIAYSNDNCFQLSAIIICLYIFIFNTLVNRKYQLIYQIIAFIASIVCLTVLYILSIYTNIYVLIGIGLAVFLSLLRKICIQIQGKYLEDTRYTGFSCQSNLLIFVYVLWKGYLIALRQASIYNLNCSSLIYSFFALSIINLLKINNIFNYDVTHVVNVFEIKNAEKLQNKEELIVGMNNTLNITVNTKNKNENDQSNKQLLPQQIPKQIAHNDNSQTIKDQDSSKDNLQTKYQESIIKSYQSKRRIITTIVYGIVFLCQIIFYFIQGNKDQDLVQLFIFTQKFTLILALCETQKIIQHLQDNLIGYILRYFCDCFCVIISAVIVYYGATRYNTQTLLFLSIYPFMTIKIFIFANKTVHENLDNGKYFSFFIIFLFLMFFREFLYNLDLPTFYYILDGLVVIYCLILLVFIANKDSIYKFFQLIKKYRSQKIKAQTLFEQMKESKFNYKDLLQSYIFINTIIQNIILAYISGLDQWLQMVYFIIQFSPLILYGLCVFNDYSFKKQYPEKYAPSFMNIMMIAVSVAYSIASYIGIIDQIHHVYSLAVLLNILLFSMIVQGQKLTIVFFQNFQNFIRIFIISTFFFLIYIPFITVFISGYYLTSFSKGYVYYYSLFGFFYIWLVITFFGVSIHLILNLTAKSNKSLFIAKYMQNEMNNINMKQNVEKILTISNLYEMMNENSQQLLNYLKSEKTIIVAVRKQKDIPYDYQFIEPEDITHVKKMSIHSKSIKNVDLIKLMKKIDHQQEEEAQNGKQQHRNPMAIMFKQKRQQAFQVQKLRDYNQNLKEIKKMAQNNLKMSQDSRIIEKSQYFKEFQAAKPQQISIIMGKTFYFLSQPSENISQETFSYLLEAITKQRNKREQANNLYNKFCQSILMNQLTFKKFVIDFIDYTFDMKDASLSDKLRTFCCRMIVPLLMKSQILKYYLKRKRIINDAKKQQIWLHGIQHVQNIEQLVKFRHKELLKKARLLVKTQKTGKKKLSEEFDDSIYQHQQTLAKQQIFAKVGKKRKLALQNSDKKQEKNKKLLKPQNIYAILVNALTQCYLFYAKQKQNFGLKSISFRLSNILAIITKITDIVFVFGYSTIYVLIAYFDDKFQSPSYALSSISYQILIIGSSVSVIVYILMMIYHKQDFEKGTLGLDQDHRSLGLKNFRFYTTNLIFLFGSGLANYVLSIALNSFICNQETNYLFNFTDTQCYTKFQYSYMLVGLLILVIYWPLSAITFPFSTAMNRDLQIKYKAEFQIVYLQIKFLINGYNNLLNPFQFKTEQLINSILKIITCSVLAILFLKTKPCSFKIMDVIEGKIYILLSILSFAGALCYFVGFNYSLIITGCVMGLYLIYFIYYTVNNFKTTHNQQEENQILQNKLKNQKMKIQILRQNQKDEMKKMVKQNQSNPNVHSLMFQTEDKETQNGLKKIPQAIFVNRKDQNNVKPSQKAFNFKSIFFL